MTIYGENGFLLWSYYNDFIDINKMWVKFKLMVGNKIRFYFLFTEDVFFF